MTVHELKLPGLLLFTPDVYGDDRGFFLETWNAARYREHGLDAGFVQDNVSYSTHGVLRGLHYQDPHPQGKLVMVLRGEIFDVAVDIREDAATFGTWEGMTLSAENKRQLYVPPGFAHGFVVTGEEALVHYKCTDYYHPEAEGTIRWDDPAIGVDWPVETPVLSEKDAAGMSLGEGKIMQ